ncbi:transposase [Oxyplasma meridianum]|uniref:Transposase n=1 Tax=Oxyplasma meridianum TaxID=3073602 RepID=A0AAX4NIJ2_9ARCH
MKIIRTEEIYIKSTDIISKMCHYSNNLYNQANYVLRQQFFNKEKLLDYNHLVKLFQNENESDNNNYRKLPAQTAQWTIKKSFLAWISFFKAEKEYRKEYRKHLKTFFGRPKPPKYRGKDGEFILIFTNQQCKIKNGILKFPKIMNLEVKTRLDDNVDLREVRIIPQGVGYKIEIAYWKEMEKEIENVRGQKEQNKGIIGIDIGVRNIVTIVDSIGNRPIAIKGGAVSSINQYFNKEYSRLKSVSDRQLEDRYMTKREKRLFMRRNRKIKDVMHKISKFIINYAENNHINTIAIGHNEGWKQKTNIGKINNQKFVQIPFNTLIQQMRYKAEEKGINVVVIDESHTSKTSFLDQETIEHHDIYKGKRILRGLFKSANGTIINADVNGSYNIMRKAIPESFEDGIEGVGLHPRSLRISQIITSKGGC